MHGYVQFMPFPTSQLKKCFLAVFWLPISFLFCYPIESTAEICNNDQRKVLCSTVFNLISGSNISQDKFSTDFWQFSSGIISSDYILTLLSALYTLFMLKSQCNYSESVTPEGAQCFVTRHFNLPGLKPWGYLVSLSKFSLCH